MMLYHYYDKNIGPFVNMSELTVEEAKCVLLEIKKRGKAFAAKRSDDYLEIRRGLEDKARQLFMDKGGKPVRIVPHYMTLGPCNWLIDWYENGTQISIPLDYFKDDIISFTYGDLFPTMRFKDGKPYRKQVYTKKEIGEVIKSFGFPQEWNMDGQNGPERYIEAQIWDDRPLSQYLRKK